MGPLFSSSPSHHSQAQQHQQLAGQEDALQQQQQHDDTYLQMRAGGAEEGVSPVPAPVRSSSTPGSLSRSPLRHDEQQQQQQLSPAGAQHPRHPDNGSGGYSPSDEHTRLHSFTHLTAMQPVSSVGHLQDDRLQTSLYLDPMYAAVAHHQQQQASVGAHHPHEHEHHSPAPHSPTTAKLVSHPHSQELYILF
ncbi:hypothetical protein QAD02_021948 [Eretmocerus hayati]|uniref:Uncharacterized protein n=1 Tax=Eretmocerus hayati TaxID=131215 RepID=A0ACC2PRD4_9HYME|nr:hypothetical protein QAD02_021948 [Eretmocerus hayati]